MSAQRSPVARPSAPTTVAEPKHIAASPIASSCAASLPGSHASSPSQCATSSISGSSAASPVARAAATPPRWSCRTSLQCGAWSGCSRSGSREPSSTTTTAAGAGRWDRTASSASARNGAHPWTGTTTPARTAAQPTSAAGRGEEILSGRVRAHVSSGTMSLRHDPRRGRVSVAARRRGLGVAVVALTLVCALIVAENAAASSICPQRYTISAGASSFQLPYCTNRSLTARDASVHRLVVVIHGTNRNASDYEGWMDTAAHDAGVTDALIVAPQFLDGSDGPSSMDLRWTSEGWKQGDES